MAYAGYVVDRQYGIVATNARPVRDAFAIQVDDPHGAVALQRDSRGLVGVFELAHNRVRVNVIWVTRRRRLQNRGATARTAQTLFQPSGCAPATKVVPAWVETHHVAIGNVIKTNRAGVLLLRHSCSDEANVYPNGDRMILMCLLLLSKGKHPVQS